MSKNLLITGASSDVGSALIQRIAGNYDKVFAHYRSSVKAIEKLQVQFGDKIVPLQADFADVLQTDNFAEKVKNYGISHFVHIPAVPNINEKFTKTAWADFEKHITVEVHSAYAVCLSIIPQMDRNSYGKIVFMLTENVARNIPGKFAIPYTSSKYALLGLMKCLSAEFANKSITVNGVSPSMIETNFVSNLPELIRQINADKSPIKRNLVPDDVISVFEYLLSDGADCVTGLNIPVGVME